jgi:uncharacterized protein (TIGR00661 family)
LEAIPATFADFPDATSPAQAQLPAKIVKTRIIYGVQGTGNGHISRAGAMNKALDATGLYDVHWVMSGRPEQPLMCCDKYDWYRGMTFATSNGRIEILKTITGNNAHQFIRDIRELRLDDYDLIITDFEPVVAWSARRQGRDVLGIGHQYAFNYKVPVADGRRISKLTLKYFAPAATKVGLHWHHFDQPILPPIVDMHSARLDQKAIDDKVLVYLPFENQDALVQLFREMPQWQFYIYSAEMEDYNLNNIHTRAISKTGFKNDLVTADAIITNSGFELISECLTLGKRILTKPLHGQIEQLSNARALSALGYATVINAIDRQTVCDWLKEKPVAWKVNYPDVAGAITGWIGERDRVSVAELAASLWQQTTVRKVSD